MKFSGLSLALGLLGICSVATAQEKPFDDRFYIAPQVSYGLFSEDNGLDLDDNYGFGGAIGKPITKWLNLEAYYFKFPGVDIENGGPGAEVDEIEGYGLTALFFPDHDAIPLYFLAGYAYGDFNTEAPIQNEEAQFIDAGVGYIQPLNDYGIALRGEYRYRNIHVDGNTPNDFSENFDAHVLSLYLQVPLGAPPEPLPVAKAKPAPAPVQPAQPTDSDGDGVPDNRDQCPGTPPGTQVNAQGCPVAKAAPIVLKGVTFEFNSARLTSDATRRLDNVVNALNSSSNINVKIEGHTDSIGSASYNEKLSDQRAASVRQYLEQHGIASNRLTSRGYGETRPVAPNTKPNGADNPEGRAQNRRVELHVKK